MYVLNIDECCVVHRARDVLGCVCVCAQMSNKMLFDDSNGIASFASEKWCISYYYFFKFNFFLQKKTTKRATKFFTF